MERRQLGRTGEMVSVLGLGGGRIGLSKPTSSQEAIALIHRALDLGVNYIDTASSYGQGASEERIGEVMKARRHEVFLAAKVDTRTRAEAEREIRGSMARLHVDTIDLLQLHGVNDEATLQRVLASDGALAVVLDAQKAGMVRFVGLTNHLDPAVLRHALELYDFDTALMPVGCLDNLYHGFYEEVMPLAKKRNIGLIGMKAVGHGVLEAHGAAAVRYALAQPVAVTLVGMNSIEQLEENVAMASPLSPLTSREEHDLLEAVKSLAHPEHMWWRRR